MTRPSAECPRCGYNLDGTVSTWTEQCPIRGRCNECGLEFDWHRVFVLTVHPWLFEYHWRRRPFSRFLQTVLYAFRPRRFWREVRLTDPVHLMPAAVVTGLLALTGAVLLIATLVLPQYLWRLSNGFPVGASFWRDEIVETTLRTPRTFMRLMPGLPVALFAMPVIFALIPITLRQARVRRRHIVRIFFYSLVAPITIACAWCAVNLMLLIIGLDRLADAIDPFYWRGHVGSSVLTTFLFQLLPGMAIVLPCTVWMANWWYLGCRRYLQLERPGRVTAVLTLILFLLATITELVFT
ncbi:MAG: hypothetical protein IIB99_05825 [Planctomycetes bacterium]|nr:hypothetical protein [Planctomycetota bacterium]